MVKQKDIESLAYLKKVWDEEIAFFYDGTRLIFALDDIVDDATHTYNIGDGETPDEKAWVALNFMRYHRPWNQGYKLAREVVEGIPGYRKLMVKAMLCNKSLKPY